MHLATGQGVALPGSPFDLHVDAGSAHPLACSIPKEVLPLCGTVGVDGDTCGCKLILQTFDQMNNACTKGGARVEFSHTSEQKTGEGELLQRAFDANNWTEP